MLKLAGESDIGLEKIEQITYMPGVQTTGDLEAGTNTVTATAKPGTADYSAALTLAKPGDARLVVKRLCSRLQVTRDSGTSTNLYCTVAVDSADGSANILFNAVDVQAANLQIAELTSGVVFDLLSDGAAHTFYFFFWVNAGNSVISLVQLWEGVGSATTNYIGNTCLVLNHIGFVQMACMPEKVGTGTARVSLFLDSSGAFEKCVAYQKTGRLYMNDYLLFSNGDLLFNVLGTVATDLNYLTDVGIVLRSEQ